MPLSLSMLCGMLHPSLPPRPNFPKSPSPQEKTNPSSERASVWASRLPQATWMMRLPSKVFTCKDKTKRHEGSYNVRCLSQRNPLSDTHNRYQSLYIHQYMPWNFHSEKIQQSALAESQRRFCWMDINETVLPVLYSVSNSRSNTVLFISQSSATTIFMRITIYPYWRPSLYQAVLQRRLEVAYQQCNWQLSPTMSNIP